MRAHERVFFKPGRTQKRGGAQAFTSGSCCRLRPPVSGPTQGHNPATSRTPQPSAGSTHQLVPLVSQQGVPVLQLPDYRVQLRYLQLESPSVTLIHVLILEWSPRGQVHLEQVLGTPRTPGASENAAGTEGESHLRGAHGSRDRVPQSQVHPQDE